MGSQRVGHDRVTKHSTAHRHVWISRVALCEGSACNARDTGSIHWRRKWQPTPVFLIAKSHGQRSLVGYSSQGLKRVRKDFVTKQKQPHKNLSLPLAKQVSIIERRFVDLDM